MQAGQLIAGRYRLVEPIGSGGMGYVWQAFDEELHRDVAMKCARRGGSEADDRRMRREARIAAGLQHPHVITVHDVVVVDGERWLVMEFLRSRSLAELLEERGALPVAETADIGAQIADALAAVHARGVVHRDVKPGNILVTDDGVAKLTDFGISRVVWSEKTLTDSGTAAGTTAYLSPEAAQGQEPAAASDVFSLGASLFAAVEGKPPFGDAENPLVTLNRAAKAEIEPIRRAGPLTPVLNDLLRRSPEERPDATDTHRRLEAIADSAPEDLRGRRFRVSRGLAFTAAGVVVALAATLWIVGKYAWPDRNPEPPAFPPAAAGVATIGDPRTADPCSLTDQAALARFGETRLDTDYGNFERCDVIVRPNPDTEVDVETQFNVPAPPDAGVVEQVGAVSVLREPARNDRCDRVMTLPDRNKVVVNARLNEGTTADLCGMADATVNTALTVLNRGPVPRRPAPFAAGSLAGVNACGLLDNTALARIPGVDATRPEIGFGDWACRWRSTTSGGSVLLRYDHDQPLTARSGRPNPIGGRDAFVEPGAEGADSCVIKVSHRRYTDDDGYPAVELLHIAADGPQGEDALCGLVTDLATAAVSRLPQP
ncbi:serine/threonine-protein kinase [Amycolatopsis anabasis]|uniref:serine/threonine-protein kinase n=1 Tax=Amycolatopsis anabasis TaxID=1840409 RepID=UPI00131AAB55|nr:serine/threonine-protein kinase [Amycolatopsis anabasis]